MFVYTALGLTILIAILALRTLWRCPGLTGVDFWLHLLTSVTLAAFIYLYGSWVFCSIYLRYAFALAWLITLFASFLRARKNIVKSSTGSVAFQTVLASVLLLTDVLFYTGMGGSLQYTDLRFPLMRGQYFVLQGGKGMPANFFHSSGRRGVFAMDIVKLDGAGRRCKQIFSKRLADYFIYGDTIYAPCSGTVLRAISNNPDNIPPHRVPGLTNLNGVLIEGTGCTVFLGHMQQGKVFVSAGQQVAAGQAIGLVGNSGMSIEPHLHIQAHVHGDETIPWYQRPQLFMRFDGKTYLLNEIIQASQ